MVFEAVGASLGLVVQPTNLLVIFIGVPIGVIAGSIPGFSGTNTVALILPMTLVLEPVTAIILMSAVYVGANYGSAIPGVLINTPGSAAAAATVLDAYPMTKQGQAGKALGISILASVFGGLISAVIIFFLLDPMASIAFQFGQAEMFVVALFGLSTVAVAVADNMRKGLIAGFFGLLIAAMPADPTTGQPRLIFGFYELYDQVPFVSIVIGLFAISELFYLVNKRRIQDEGGSTDLSYDAVSSGFRHVLGSPLNVLRSAGIGTVIGAIPGSGASVANFVSWIVAKTASSDSQSYGQGNPDGIVASEASNNAVTGGSLIPTLTLGIPGSGTTAVMLAALLLHGLQPGPRLLQEFDVEANAIILSLFIANVALLLFAFFISKYIIRVVLLPTNWLVPTILVLTAISAFALRNSMFDVWVMVLFGFIGFLMREHDYPIIPLVLGVILGPIAEAAFLRGMLLSRNDPGIFFSSPITLVLWALIVLTILWQPLQSRFRDRLPF